MGHLQKVGPNESGSLERFTFMMWYVNEEVSLDSTEEAEILVGWYCKSSMLDIQQKKYLKIHSLKREQE